MARFFANENLPEPVVIELRRLGHDAVTMRDSGFAGRGMHTLNRQHFVKLHEDRPAHAGIVVCPFDPDLAALARRIHEAVGPGADLAGRLFRVNRPS